MSRNYTEDELKDIGKQCGNRLPPASAVQAMFLYEMQRDKELQCLFQGQMFQLAKAEAQSNSYEARIWGLEEQFKALEKRVTAKDVNERLVTSRVRTDALQCKLNQETERMDSHGERLVALEKRVAALSATNAKTAKDDSIDVDGSLIQLEAVRADLTAADSDIQVLFDERDALVTLIEQAKMRIEKLEGNVRALTAQTSSHGSNPSSTTSTPPPTQHLPVKTSNGECVDLEVPKVKSWKAFDSRAIPFSPGKQWMT